MPATVSVAARAIFRGRQVFNRSGGGFPRVMSKHADAAIRPLPSRSATPYLCAFASHV